MKVEAQNHEPRDTSDAREMHRLLRHLKVVSFVQAAAFPAAGVAAILSFFWTPYVLLVTVIVAACAIVLARWVTAHHKKALLALLAKNAELKPEERQRVKARLNLVSVGGPAEL